MSQPENCNKNMKHKIIMYMYKKVVLQKLVNNIKNML